MARKLTDRERKMKNATELARRRLKEAEDRFDRAAELVEAARHASIALTRQLVMLKYQLSIARGGLWQPVEECAAASDTVNSDH